MTDEPKKDPSCELYRNTLQRRLYVNGLRTYQGKDRDWYDLDDGKIMVLHLRPIRPSDFLVMEYPARGIEEQLPMEKIMVECASGCGAPVPPHRPSCKQCERRQLAAKVLKLQEKLDRTYIDAENEIERIRKSSYTARKQFAEQMTQCREQLSQLDAEIDGDDHG